VTGKDFATLASGETIWITASNRQARFWREQYHQFMSQQAEVWPAPDILPLDNWLKQLYREMAKKQAVPTLLNHQQGLWLWQDIISNSAYNNRLISSRATASSAYEGFQQLQAWQLQVTDITPDTIDHQAFIEWATNYQSLLSKNNWLDSSQLLNWLLDQLGHENRGALLKSWQHCRWLGFHQLTPQQQALIARIKDLGIDTHLEQYGDAPAGHSIEAFVCQDFSNELNVAGSWLRERITNNPQGRYALVVPDLEKHRTFVETTLRAQLQPESLHVAEPPAAVFNLSVGEPIAELPMFRSLMHLLTLLGGRLEREALAELLRSRHFGLCQAFYDECCRIAFALPANERSHWRLPDLSKLLHKELQATGASDSRNSDYQQLTQSLQQLEELSQQTRIKQTPEQWLTLIGQWLILCGWPEQKTKSSRQYQLLEQLHQGLQSLRQLAPLRQGIDYATVLQWLRQTFEGQQFQAQSLGQPIQVLGLYEPVAQQFDAVWICSLSSEILPQPGHPNPFIPLRFARQHQLPGSGPERELAFARSLRNVLLQTSDHLVISYHAQDNERELSASPLLKSFVDRWQIPQPASTLFDRLTAAEKESFVDEKGQPYPSHELKGGSRFLQQQSQCPMQAYLQHRLKIEEQDAVSIDIDPLERGTLMHQIMDSIWQALKNQQALNALDDQALIDLIQSHLDRHFKHRFMNSGELKTLEKEKYLAIIFEFLTLEKLRQSDFAVIEREQDRSIEIGGMTIKTRLDRVDQVGKDQRLVIDYKTGKTNSNHWLGERIGEPQLPLYLLADEDQVIGISFARLRAKDVAFDGIANDESLAPGILLAEKKRGYDGDWSRLVKDFRSKIETLIKEIQQGDARVAPDEKLNPCRNCALDSICRISEIDIQTDEEAAS